MKKVRAGIVGGAGYTGGELVRLLLNHPGVELAFVHSKSNHTKFIYQVHRDLLGETDLQFTQDLQSGVDVLFLCLGHGEARKFIQANPIEERTRIIDLSQDFRINTTTTVKGRSFIYGLPEWNNISQQNKDIANPGCFATCIQLALLPLAHKGLLKSEVHVSATTGSTGAGQPLTDTSHFSWRQNNLSIYKALEHQHLAEIGQSVAQLQPGFTQNIYFIPARGSFTRGIFATLYTSCDLGLKEAVALYKEAYAGKPFVHISTEPIDLKQVVNTNKCLLHVEKHGTQLVVTSVIDNLLKGASGQAVQNMNLLFGLEETSGLKLKAVAF